MLHLNNSLNVVNHTKDIKEQAVKYNDQEVFKQQSTKRRADFFVVHTQTICMNQWS